VGQLPFGDVARTHARLGDEIELDEDVQRYALELARGSWDAKPTLDGYIADAATNWRVERLAVIDRLLLRIAVYELLRLPATPPRVVIDEAIELARLYSGEDAARFVNGVLDGVFRRLKEEGKVVD
jgi:N utilization substance protein B